MKKKLIIIISIIVVIVIGLFSFYYIKNKDHLEFKKEYTSLNNKSFKEDDKKGKYISLNINSNNPIIYLNDSNIVKEITNESKMILFGKENNNTTRSIIETLFKVAKDNSVEKIYYYKVTDNSKLNDKIIETINNDSIKKLEVPLVIVVNKGKIVSYHIGSVDSHKDYMKKLNSSEQSELYKIYENMILDLIMCTDDC